MDFDLNSSDFEFPSDTGLSKLSSPLSFKVPESRDWALDEFMQTLSSKPCMEADNLTSFKQYIPVQKGDDEFNCGPPKLSLSFFEEKDFLSQMSQRFLDLERNELLDILKGGFSLVQNDIQTNSASPFTSPHPDINWFDEALDYGHRTTSTIEDLGDIEFKRVSGFSPFAPRHQSVHESEIEQDLITPISIPLTMEINKPLPALPVLPITTTADTTTTNKKKGLKYKLKSKLIKSFTPPTNKKKNFLSNTKKFITKIFPTKNTNP